MGDDLGAISERWARRNGWRVALPGALLLLSVYALNVWHFWFLTDDAFISFRYAHHLVEGLGLVWNPGEAVEGYTNFLWVLLMAAALAAGAEPERASLALGIGSGIVSLGILLVWSARLRGWGSPIIWIAPFALAFSRTYTAWSTSGLETLCFTMLSLAGLLVFLRECERPSEHPWRSSLLLGLASLMRPEGALFAIAAFALHGVEVLRGRRSPRSWLVAVAPWALLVGGHLLWRIGYYGEWLPNTFYAKVPAAWWDQGGRYLALFHEDYRAGWFLPLALAGCCLRRDRAGVLFTAVVALYLIYVLAVGGDRFEFRFLVPILPYFYWLVAEGLGQIDDRAAARGIPRGLRWVAIAAVTGALLVSTHLGSRRPEAIKLRHGVTSVQGAGQYAEYRAAEGRFLREMIQAGVLPEDVVLALGGAGAVPYYTDWTTVDIHGLNDHTVARMPLPTRGVIAHERKAPLEYLERRGVVVFDVLNRLVHPDTRVKERRQSVTYRGRPLPLKAVRVKGRYLIFATTVTDAELAAAFPGLELFP